MDRHLVEQFASYCECNLDFTVEVPSGYNSAPICALDSVFSIGVKYGAVCNVITNFLTTLGDISQDSCITTTEVLARLQTYNPEELADALRNHNRTDSRPGSILKSEAYIEFLKVMQSFGVETCEDIINNSNNQSLREALRAIRGQSSGITFDYINILARNHSYVKVDRHIKRFVSSCFPDTRWTQAEIISLIQETAACMSESSHEGMTARYLDHLIWSYQRGLKD